MSKDHEDLLLALREFRHSLDRATRQPGNDPTLPQISKDAIDWLGRYEYRLAEAASEAASGSAVPFSLITQQKNLARSVRTIGQPLQVADGINGSDVWSLFEIMLSVLPGKEHVPGIPPPPPPPQLDAGKGPLPPGNIRTMIGTKQMKSLQRTARAMSGRSVAGTFNITPVNPGVKDLL